MSVLFLVIFVRMYEKRLIDDYTNASFHINSLLEASLENAMLKRDIPGLQQIVKKLGEQPGIDGVYIANPTFEVRFSHDNDAVGQSFPDLASAINQNQSETTALFLNGNSVDTATVLRSINPVLNKPPCEDCHGPVSDHPVNGYLIIDYISSAIRQSARQAVASLALSGGVVVLLTIIAIAWALKRLVVTPIARMSAACRAIGSGDPGARTGVNGGDEIGSLGSSLDRMAIKLETQREKLQRNRAFIQAVIDAVPDGIRVIGSNYQICMANKAYCEQRNTSLSTVLQHKCYQSSHSIGEPCAASLVTCPHFEFLHGQKQTLKCRQRHVTNSGTERYVEVYAGRLDTGPDGEPGEFIVESIRDLSSQITLSKEHRLSEIGHLATGVAHEIHNPLSSISLAIRSISADTENSTDYHRISPYLQIVEDEIQRCIGITGRLLKLSQPDSSQRELIDMEEVVREVFTLLGYQAAEAGISTVIRSDENVRVLAVSSDMHMLILNTVQNAFHAMPNGGALTVSITRQTDMLKLNIKDTGCGIELEDSVKVFWPFWSMRADKSTGTGLGLAICRSIVEKHDGLIELISSPGKGAELLIQLPAADKISRGKPWNNQHEIA
jgi:signal transduction histidine kinase/HAMP domain-containing protein